jgi:hypothetical protein
MNLATRNAIRLVDMDNDKRLEMLMFIAIEFPDLFNLASYGEQKTLTGLKVEPEDADKWAAVEPYISQFQNFASKNKFVDSIKLVRHITGSTLSEARDFVEKYIL